MKKLLITLFLAVAFASCEKSKIDTAKANIEIHIKENMDNPKSYEFVSMDSLKVFSHADSLIAVEKLLIYENTILDYEEYTQPNLKTIDSIKTLFKNPSKLESLKKEILGYNTKITFRGTNKLGALIKNTKKIRLNKNLKPF